MKAYVYRSGHVLIGHTVPEGAIELADWDNETELLMVCRFLFPMIEDAEGQPTMACPVVIRTQTYKRMPDELVVIMIRAQLKTTLKDLREHPPEFGRFQVGSIEGWSNSVIAKIQEMFP